MNDDLKEKISKMSNEEYEAFLKERELEHTASVSDFIKYLSENFNENDKLCYIDCVEGAKYDATPIKKSDLGVRFFKYVKDDKDRIIKGRNLKKEDAESFYPYVNDCDVIVI